MDFTNITDEDWQRLKQSLMNMFNLVEKKQLDDLIVKYNTKRDKLKAFAKNINTDDKNKINELSIEVERLLGVRNSLRGKTGGYGRRIKILETNEIQYQKTIKLLQQKCRQEKIKYEQEITQMKDKILNCYNSVIVNGESNEIAKKTQTRK
jgi:hypothetical protein